MSEQRRWRLDDLDIDLDRQRVERAGVVLDVGGLSFRLLEFLLGQDDRVVTFDQLMAAVWAPSVVGEETVTQRVKLLRQALGDDGRNPRYLRSVRGRGYQLCVAAHPLAGEGVARSPRLRRWRWLIVGVGVIVGGLILAVLTITMRPNAWTQPAPPSSQNDLLQRARYYAGIGQAENNERAIALYEELLGSDAGNVAAQVGLSHALSARLCLYNAAPDSSTRGESIARALIARDADNGAAHAALAYALDCQGLIDTAIVEYERAYALDPVGRGDSLASAANLYAVKGRLYDALKANIAIKRSGTAARFLDIQIARTLELLGFTAAAEQRYARSFRLYPDNVFSNANYPRCLFLQGRLAEATEALDQAITRPQHPDLHVLTGELALLRGSPVEARAAFARALALRPHASFAATLVRLYDGETIDRTWALSKLVELRAQFDSGQHWPDTQIEIALIEMALGERDRAFAALDAAVASGFRDRAYLQVSPLFRALADDPRFAVLLDSIGTQVAAQRRQVLAGDEFPPQLLSPTALP